MCFPYMVALRFVYVNTTKLNSKSLLNLTQLKNLAFVIISEGILLHWLSEGKNSYCNLVLKCFRTTLGCCKEFDQRRLETNMMSE